MNEACVLHSVQFADRQTGQDSTHRSNFNASADFFFRLLLLPTTTITNAATFVYTMFIESNRIGRLLLLFCFDEFLVEKNLSFSSLFLKNRLINQLIRIISINEDD